MNFKPATSMDMTVGVRATTSWVTSTTGAPSVYATTPDATADVNATSILYVPDTAMTSHNATRYDIAMPSQILSQPPVHQEPFHLRLTRELIDEFGMPAGAMSQTAHGPHSVHEAGIQLAANLVGDSRLPGTPPLERIPDVMRASAAQASATTSIPDPIRGDSADQNYEIHPTPLSDGKLTVGLFVELEIEGKVLRAKVVPPKGSSDGFHEALDSRNLQEAMINTQELWDVVRTSIQADPSLLARPEKICAQIDAVGGWRRYGAQAALSVREVVFKLAAQYRGITLEQAKHDAYKRAGGLNNMAFAHPMSVMLSAAKHGNGIVSIEGDHQPWNESIAKRVTGLPWQEWMVQMTFTQNPQELIRAGEQFHDVLFWLLRTRGDIVTKLSKEGGMTVTVTKTPYEIIALYKDAVRELGARLDRDLELGRDVHLAIDAAATEAYFPERYVYDQSALGLLRAAIGDSPAIDKADGKIRLDRHEHYIYTEHVRQAGGHLADFHTEGAYHIVLSDGEAGTFTEYLGKQRNVMAPKLFDATGRHYSDESHWQLEELEDAELAQAGYKKFALNSLQQAMLARHLMDSTGRVFSSIEDIMSEDDWPGWQIASVVLDGVQLVGDDSWVTNPARMVRAYHDGTFNIVPLIKENQVADPWKAILMIALSENVQYLISRGRQEYVNGVIRKPEYDDLDSVDTIQALVGELNARVEEIGLPDKPFIAAVVSHRSKSYGPDVDLALALATGSTGKIGAIANSYYIQQWPGTVDPYFPALLTRSVKYKYALRAAGDPDNPTTFNANSVAGVNYTDRD